MPIVKPLVSRVPRKKTEREVWSPNFFPELSRVRKLTSKTDWARGIRVGTALALLVAGLVQVVHSEGVVGAARDAATAAESVVSAVSQGDSPDLALAGSEAKKEEGERTEKDITALVAPEDRRVLRLRSQAGEAKADVGGAGSLGPQPPSDLPQLTETSIPDAEIVFVSNNGPKSEIYKTDPLRGGVVRLTENSVRDEHPAWSPDGRTIAFSRSSGLEHPTEIWIMEADGTGERSVLSLGEQDSYEYVEAAEVSWSPDSLRLVFSYRGAISVVDVDGSRQKLLAHGRSPEWSPDGEKIVFERESTLWTMRADGSEERQITFPRDPEPADSDPTWSPDGKQIIFARGGVGAFAGGTHVSTWGVFAVRDDGSGVRRISEGLGEVEPSSSPSGDQVVYASSDGNLYLIDMDGSSKRKLTRDGSARYGSDTFYSSPDWRWPPT